MSLPALDKITGALLIGTWASSLLYMAELIQAVYYFRNFKDDEWKLKTLVAVTFAIDTLSAIGDYIGVYLYTISHAGDLEYLSKQNWTVPLYIFSTYVIAFLVQSFLVYRYWRFTHNTTLSLFLFVLIIAALGVALASGLTIVLFPALEDRRKVLVSGTISLIFQVLVDVSIAALLVWELWRAKKSLLEHVQIRMNNTLNRLVVRTLQTGSATAAIAVATLIAFLIDNKSNIPVGIMFCGGRVYTLTMLFNLNIRSLTKPGSSRGTSSSVRTPGEHTSIVFVRGDTQNLSGIHVHRTALVHIDDRKDYSSVHLDNNNYQDIPKLSFNNAPDDHSSPVEIELTSRKQSELVAA
ncbi:hypothetical protein C8J57DRAFT_1725630 [Mycena rebaudengoi]|nr:hypothetical protein C8J57DRAFT_1725630 [Mycena rebaudengoi]